MTKKGGGGQKKPVAALAKKPQGGGGGRLQQQRKVEQHAPGNVKIQRPVTQQLRKAAAAANATAVPPPAALFGGTARAGGLASSSSSTTESSGRGGAAAAAAAGQTQTKNEALAALRQKKVISNPPLFFEAGTTIIVRNLHPDVTSKDFVLGMFDDGGDVISALVHRDAEGRSLGSAQVEFAEPAAARLAFTRLNGHILMGQMLKCSLIGDSYKHPNSDANAKQTAEEMARAAAREESRAHKRRKQEGHQAYVDAAGGEQNFAGGMKRKLTVVKRQGAGPGAMQKLPGRRVVKTKRGTTSIVVTRDL